MNTKLAKWYYLIPLIHIGVIALFLYLQFSGTGAQISIPLGEAVLAGSGIQGREGSVSRLALNYGGMQLTLDRIDMNGTSVSLRTFYVDEQRVFLHYGNGLVLELVPGGIGTGSGITGDSGSGTGISSGTGPDASPGTASVSSGLFSLYVAETDGPAADALGAAGSAAAGTEDILGFSYSFPRDQGFRRVGVLPAYEFGRGPGKYLIALLSGGFVDMSRDVIGFSLDLSLSGGKKLFSAEAVDTEDLVAYWFFGDEGPVTGEEYDRILSMHREKAYRGWRTSRFNASAGTWSHPGRRGEFNEKAAAALMAEAYRRQELRVFSVLQTAASAHQRSVTYLTAPYFGDIVTTDAPRRQADGVLTRNLSSKALAGDYEIFSTPNIVTLAAFSRSPGLIRDLNTLAEKIDPNESFPASIRTGLAEAYVESASRFSDQFPAFVRLYPEVVEELFPLIKKTAAGLFLHDETDTVDTLLSLRAGLVLQKIGSSENVPLYESIGRDMVVSVLNLGDGAGFLPESLEFSNGEMVPAGNPAGPEEFYAYLDSGAFYPRMVSLKKELDRDIEVWTAAEEVQGRMEGNSLILEFAHPVEQIHHLVVRGVQPFDHIFMFGIRWNSDRRFQSYFSGWYYDSSTMSLYVKLRHRQRIEQLVINY